jgi:hypothetical protein
MFDDFGSLVTLTMTRKKLHAMACKKEYRKIEKEGQGLDLN